MKRNIPKQLCVCVAVYDLLTALLALELVLPEQEIPKHVRSQFHCSRASRRTTLNLRKSATATKLRTCIIQIPSAQGVSSCCSDSDFLCLCPNTQYTFNKHFRYEATDGRRHPRTTSTKVLAPPGGRTTFRNLWRNFGKIPYWPPPLEKSFRRTCTALVKR